MALITMTFCCSVVASSPALESRNGSTTPHSRHAYTLDHVKPLHGQEHGTLLVLSVDDDPVAHMLLREVLTPEGYKVRGGPVAAAGGVHRGCPCISEQPLPSVEGSICNGSLAAGSKL